MTDLSRICIECGKPEARHSYIGDNCPSEAGLYLATTFRAEGEICLRCKAPLRDQSQVFPIKIGGKLYGWQNDSHGRCAVCKVLKAIDDARAWDAVCAEILGEEEHAFSEPDDSQYVN